MSDWITITSKFANKCIVCGNMVEIGEKIHWKKGEGVKHIEDCQECEAVTPTDELIIVEDTEWKDFKTYSYTTLQKIENCQRCGIQLDKTKDTFMNCDRRTCERCFSK